ncbi:MAG: DUF3696 domain-containing protein [Gracilimonas sp.]|uniref:DUF3696 domain-containing protein n=1 Tax=Gracilimonas sp. TaxID=1974203 RepID=UPI001B147419|nr:DUF3696 domain-containing protein [Gracilimonas sp.]MBO6586786.1 DUF3696 domain-containing protein [Gracilimonas sp.]MBO6615443.1 DUF3696 domain-containing protein [Gracilimonas sp.]
MIDTSFNKHIIENFKAYSDRQEIIIKPITLIFGTNNAGKSSLLKSLMYVHHFFKYKQSDLIEVQEGDEIIDYGGIHQIINYGAEGGKFRFGREIKVKGDINRDIFREIANTLNTAQITDLNLAFFKWEGDLKWEVEIDVKNFDATYITSVELLFNDIKGEVSILSDNGVEKENFNFPETAKLKLAQDNENKPYLNLKEFSDGAEILIMSLLNKNIMKSETGNLLHLEISNLKKLIDSAEISITGDFLRIRQDGNFSEIYNWNERESELIKSDIHNFINDFFINPFNEIYPFRVRTTSYFGPLRAIPERIVNSTHIEDNAWYNLLEDDFGFEDYETGEETSYREIINMILTSEDRLNLNLEFVQETFKSNLNDHREIKNLALRNTISGHILSLRDVGTGLSQLLPIVVELISRFENDDIIIEQPELHLHPGLQSKFGRLLSYTFRPNRNIIMETHSEHIIKSLQLEVTKYHTSDGEQGISKDDIAILYVSNKEGGAHVREMKLDESGAFTEPWPDDFFELSADLTMERLKSRYKSMN